MKLSLLVLAAGMGSRYGGLKQLDPIGPNGESLLEYCVYDSLQCGFNKVVVTIRRDIEVEFRSKIGKRIEAMTDLEYVFQEMSVLPPASNVNFERTKPWGTAHAIWCARDAIAEPFAVINADDFYGRDAFKLIASFLPNANSKLYAMVAYRLVNTLSKFGGVARGICNLDDSGCLSSVEETFDIKQDDRGVIRASSNRALAPQQLVSMNLWGFSPDIFGAIEKQLIGFINDPALNGSSEFYIPKVVEQLIITGNARVRVLETSAQWFGLTYLNDREAARAAIKIAIERGEFPTPLAAL